MNLVNIGLAITIALPFFFAGINGSKSIDVADGRSDAYHAGEAMGRLTMIFVLPAIIGIAVAFSGLISLEKAFVWKAYTKFLILVGVLTTGCFCLGPFWYFGIIIYANRKLAEFGAPNWSSISGYKLRKFADQLAATPPPVRESADFDTGPS